MAPTSAHSQQGMRPRALEWNVDLFERPATELSAAVSRNAQTEHVLPDGLIDRLPEHLDEMVFDRNRRILAAWQMYMAYLNGGTPTDIVTTATDGHQAAGSAELLVAESGIGLQQTFADCLKAWRAPGALQPLADVDSESCVLSIDPRADGAGSARTAATGDGLSLPPGSDMHVCIVQRSGVDTVSCAYRAGAIDGVAAQEFLAGFALLIGQVVADADIAIADLECLSDAERQRLIQFGRGAELDSVDGETVLRKLTAHAQTTPESAAMRVDGQATSYATLRDDVAVRLGWLVREGIEPGQRIGVMMQQSPELVSTLLALLARGCTYIPLDAKLPEARISYICEDAGVRTVLADSKYDGEIAGLVRTLLFEDGDKSPISPAPCDAPAYVLYTSGSTGKPKGVEVSRRAMAAHNMAIVSDYALGPKDRVLQFANPIFDVAVEEIFPTLVSGASIVFLPDKDQMSIGEFNEFLEEQGVTVANLPANFWHEWVRFLADNKRSVPPALRLVIAGSDRVATEAFKTWQELTGGAVEFRNGYGPTEATVTATLFNPVGHVWTGATVPIGRPVANMRAVVARKNKLVPFGVRGELLLSGPQLAEGYLGRPDLTEKAFVTMTIDGQEARWYRTGDEVLLGRDGVLRFVGRIDHQVKVNGYRIELAEIERVVQEIDEVVLAAAVVCSSRSGVATIALYYETADGKEIDAEELTNHAARSLPAYMLPSRVKWLRRMPMTASGKVDRNALPEIATHRPDLVNPMVPPSTVMESSIAEIWREELGVTEVGVLDNFFELGGNSMIGLRVIESIRKEHRIALTAAQFFQYPTISGIAKFVDSDNESAPVREEDAGRGARQRLAAKRFRQRGRGRPR